MRQSISTNTHWSSDGNKLCKLNCDTLQATKVNARVYGHVSLMFTRIADQSQAKPFLTKAAFTAQSTAENNFTLRNPMVLSSLLKRQQREKLFSEVNRNFSQSHRFIISSRRVSNNEYRKKKKSATTPTTNNKNNEKTKSLHRRHTTTPVSCRQHAIMTYCYGTQACIFDFSCLNAPLRISYRGPRHHMCKMRQVHMGV